MKKAANYIGTFLLVFPFSLVLPACSLLLGGDSEISFESLPADIRSQAAIEIGENQIVEVEREWQFGRRVYAINYLSEGIEWELEYARSGELISKSVEED